MSHVNHRQTSARTQRRVTVPVIRQEKLARRRQLQIISARDSA